MVFVKLSKSILMKLIKEELNSLYEWGESGLAASDDEDGTRITMIAEDDEGDDDKEGDK